MDDGPEFISDDTLDLDGCGISLNVFRNICASVSILSQSDICIVSSCQLNWKLKIHSSKKIAKKKSPTLTYRIFLSIELEVEDTTTTEIDLESLD